MDTLSENWARLTPSERMDLRFERWQNDNAMFVSNSARDTFRARTGRMTMAMRMSGIPDRVPVPMATSEWYPVHRAGLTPYDAMYDFDRTSDAYKEFHSAFSPDAMVSPTGATLPGKAFELLGYRLYSWPGHGVPGEAIYQYVEREWMLEDEYDQLISDPSDYLLRTYLPRIASGLEGFGKLGTVLDPAVMVFSTAFWGSLANPEVIESLENAAAAGREVLAWLAKLVSVVDYIRSLGFPGYFNLATEAPFDYLGDNLRGTKAVFMDMYRCPEKVLAACERLTPLMIRWATEKADASSTPGVLMPLHKGADGFMSLDQFRAFYWPSLLAVIEGLNEQGLMPILFAEGRYGTRLDLIADELPPGKSVWYFDRTDMARAKRTVGRVAAIQGNIPLSLMHAGSPIEVKDYCRRLIDVAAPGGGFLLDIGAVMHQARQENLEVVLEAAATYGAY